MAKIWEAKITHRTLTFSPFTAESMASIGSIVLDSSILPRIRSATDATDSPARALTARYAAEKVKGRRVSQSGGQLYRGAPVRDWHLRGWTLASLKVKSASEDRVTLGPINQSAYLILASRNPKDNMWGVSPRDAEVMYAAVRAELLRARCIRWMGDVNGPWPKGDMRNYHRKRA